MRFNWKTCCLFGLAAINVGVVIALCIVVGTPTSPVLEDYNPTPDINTPNLIGKNYKIQKGNFKIYSYKDAALCFEDNPFTLIKVDSTELQSGNRLKKGDRIGFDEDAEIVAPNDGIVISVNEEGEDEQITFYSYDLYTLKLSVDPVEYYSTDYESLVEPSLFLDDSVTAPLVFDGYDFSHLTSDNTIDVYFRLSEKTDLILTENSTIEFRYVSEILDSQFFIPYYAFLDSNPGSSQLFTLLKGDGTYSTVSIDYVRRVDNYALISCQAVPLEEGWYLYAL